MHKIETLHLYRPCVGVMLLNKKREVFVGKRADNPGDAWQMPQGGIEDHEPAEIAMWRELKEEIGTTNARIIEHTTDWITYDLPDDLKGELWGGNYIGQKQMWFLCEFLGKDEEIDIYAHDSKEFTDWKWAKAATLPDLIVPFKRKIYEELLQRFAKHLK